MKLFRRLSAWTMVLALLLSLSISVFAVDYDAADYDQFVAALGDTSGEDVNINVTADIDAYNNGFTLQDGVAYYISSENDSTIGNIGLGGDATVSIDTDVNGAIVGFDGVDIAVNGDVSDYADAINGSSVTVDGDVGGNVYADSNSNITVDGNVAGDANAYLESSISVSGNIGGNAFAYDNSDMTAGGNVGGSAEAGLDSSTTVGGDVGGNVWTAENGQVTVDGNVAGYVDAYAGSSAVVAGDAGGHIYASEGGKIEIGGDAGDGIDVYEDGSVTVGGDLIGSVNANDDAAVEIAGNVSADSEDDWVGVNAEGNSTVTVGGNVAGWDSGVEASGNATVTIGGNVTGSDNITYPGSDYIRGGTAVLAYDNATVQVAGDAIGGSAEGDEYAYGGVAVNVWGYEGDAPTVTIGGDAIGGNASSTSEEPYAAQGGAAVQMSGSANVTVKGNASSGDSDGSKTIAMPGVMVDCAPGEAAGSLTVGGTVTGGAGQDDQYGDLYIISWNPDGSTEAAEAPDVKVGSAGSVFVEGFGEEEDAAIKAQIEASFTNKKYSAEDLFNDILWLIRTAKAGDEITVDVHDFKILATAIIEAVKEADVKLIIKWDGGDDLVIDKNFSAEIEGATIELTELAELLKK